MYTVTTRKLQNFIKMLAESEVGNALLRDLHAQSPSAAHAAIILQEYLVYARGSTTRQRACSVCLRYMREPMGFTLIGRRYVNIARLADKFYALFEDLDPLWPSDIVKGGWEWTQR